MALPLRASVLTEAIGGDTSIATDHVPGMNTLAIIATSFGFALVQLDVSILNVALPRIGDTLGSGVSGLQWVVDAYAIVFASLLLGGGALGDCFGARRMYVCGLTLFTLASLGCSMAPGEGVLIAARVLQGAGAALLVPCSLALLTHACGCDNAARARAISLWTAAGSVALSIGPPLGGLLVDTMGWRSIFLVNLPIGVIGIVTTSRTLAETPPCGGALDLKGQILSILALFGLAGAIIEAGRFGFHAPLVPAGFAIAALSSIAFLIVETRAADPMLPLGFFRNPTFSAATVVGLAINFTLYGMIFALGLYLQQTLHYTPIQAGLAFVPLPIVLGMANLAAGRVSLRFSPRVRLASGLLIAGLGYCLLGHLYNANSYVSLLPGLVLIPAGIGLAVPLMTSALLSTVPRARSGTAAGVLNTVRQAAGGIGVASFGALLAGRGVSGLDVALMLSVMILACAAIVALLGIRPAQSESRPAADGPVPTTPG